MKCLCEGQQEMELVLEMGDGSLYQCKKCGNAKIVDEHHKCPTCKRHLFPVGVKDKLIIYACKFCRKVFTVKEE